MAINLNADPIVSKVVGGPYGIEFIYIFIIVSSIVAILYFIAKSGFILNLIEFLEYRSQRIDKEIAAQEKILEDDSLAEFKSQLEYHVKVSKLARFLNIDNNDIDLLNYILSCKDHKKAVRLYNLGKDYLEKDSVNKIYKIKPKFDDAKIKKYTRWATISYFLISFIGALPFLMEVPYRISRNELPLISTQIMYFVIFIVFLLIAMTVLRKYLKPEAAKNFLELEKI